MPNPDGTPTAEETQKQEAEAKAKAEADAKAKADAEKNALDAETKRKETHLLNINKAIEEAEEDLRKKRAAAKDPDPNLNPNPNPTPPVEPQIDMNDPAAKAWDKHINEKVTPFAKQNEAEKAEIRKFALGKFLEDKPALAADPEKVKELMDVYSRIATNTGKTQEGVLLDLKKAFGAIYSEQLIDAARSGRVERAKELALFSEPAIDKGATGYGDNKPKRPNLSADDMKQLAQWGMTPEQYYQMLEKQRTPTAE